MFGWRTMDDTNDSPGGHPTGDSVEADLASGGSAAPSPATGGLGAPLPRDEAGRLAMLEQCCILDTPEDPAFDDLTRLAAQICEVPVALISLIDGARQWFKSRVGLELMETPRRLAFCAYAILDPEKMLIVPDATQDPRFAGNELVTGPMGIRFYAGAPLVMEDGYALGSLCVIDQRPRELTVRQREALTVLARQVVSLIRLRRQNFALEEARAGREQFFTLALDLLCIAGMDGYFKRLNPAFSEVLGFTTEELLASPFASFIHPEDVAVTMEAIAGLGKGLAIRNFEVRFRRKDATYRWLSWKCAPTSDGMMYATARDITDQRRSEERLRLSDALVRQFVTHAPAAIAMLDREMHYLQVSDRWLIDHGRAGEDLIGKRHYEVFPEIPERWKEIHRRVLAGAVERCAEDAFTSASGATEWLQWEARPWHSAAGEIGGMILFTQFITDRKRAEAQLIESEKRFREAIEYSAIGMALVGIDGRFVKVNRALCSILGRAEEELLQSTFQAVTHPDDLEIGRAEMEALRDGVVDHFQVEKRYFHRDGRTIMGRLAVTLVRDADGRPVHFVAQVEDITERHEAERLLKASLAEKETLLKEIHHRVKNNLQVISSLLQLQSDGLTEPRMLALFRESQDRVRAMALIHEGLYRSGNLAAVNFGTHLTELTGNLLRSYGTGPTPVRMEMQAEPVELDIDVAVPLSLIVNELVTNAFKHGFAKGRGGTLRVTFRTLEGGALFLSIGDDGPGLPPGYDAERSPSLGLKIVRILVTQLGGRLDIAGPPGVTFSITFPRTRTAPSP